MRIAILSHTDAVLAVMDNTVPGALHFFSDKLHTYLKGTANTFEFTVLKKHKDSDYLKVGNKIAFIHNNKHYYLNIVETTATETEVSVLAYAGSLELINETCGAYSGSSKSFASYLAAFDKEKVLTIGLNEVSDKRISIDWTNEETLLARLFSLADNFSAELEFVPELSNNYELGKMIVNVYQKHDDDTQGIGENRTDIVLRYGRQITGIKKKSNITGLYTAIKPTGKDGLTIKSLAGRTVTDTDGTILYEVGTDGVIYAPKSRLLFPSNLNSDDRYITKTYTYDTDKTEMLYGQALAQLKAHCMPELTYEVDGFIDSGLGDTFTISDTEMDLYLSARVIEQEISFTEPQTNKTTFGNYIEQANGLSDDIQKRMENLISASAPYELQVISSAGEVFERTRINTTLTAKVMKGNKELTEADLTAAGLVVRWTGSDGSTQTGMSIAVATDAKTVFYRATLEDV